MGLLGGPHSRVIWWALALMLGLLRAAHAGTFGYKKAITIDRTKVGASGTAATTISNFPFLFSVTDASLSTTSASSGRVKSASGYDIVFRATDTANCPAGSSSACGLDHQLESYVASSGQVVAWVRVPSLNTNANSSSTVIYVYYGNSTVTSSSERPTAVWDSSFLGVWHLSEDPSGTAPQVRDSTSNANHGTSNGSMPASDSVAAQIGKGLTFDKSNDYIDFGDINAIDGASQLTMTAWVKASADNGWPTIASKTSNNGARVEMNGGNGATRSDIFCFVGNVDNTYGSYSGGYTTGSWHHWTMAYDGTASGNSNRLKFYLDGVSQSLTYSGTVPATLASITNPFQIGDDGNADRFGGVLDEVRVSSSTRSSDEITTDYNTQSSPSTFISVAAEQAAGTTDVKFTGGEALRFGDGRVFVSWRTGLEVENLGFHVYRERGGVMEKITPAILSGSLLGNRTGAASYGFWDPEPQPASVAVSYRIEDLDARGFRTLNGALPLRAAPAGATAVLPKPTMFLSDLQSAEPPASWSRTKPSGYSSIIRLPASLADSVVLSPGPAVPGTAMKLFVRDEGWYRVDASTLRAAGFAGDVDPRRLAVFVDGRQQAIRVGGTWNGSAPSGDFVEFYGRGRDSQFTDQSVYWLEVGPGDGLRLSPAAASTPAPSEERPQTFPFTVTRKDRVLYVAALLNGPTSNFFGQVIAERPVELPLEVHHRGPAAAGEERLSVALQGLTDQPHSVRLQLNGADIGTVDFAGRQRGLLDVPAGTLREGANTVRLVRAAGEMDVSLVDSVTLSYRHAMVADGERLLFTSTGGQSVTVRGFAGAAIRAVDVTDPDAPVKLAVATAAGATGYDATVSLPGSHARRVLVFADADVRGPEVIEVPAPALAAPDGGADLVIISHADFVEKLAPLKELRERQGLHVAVVDASSIYDAFSHGHKDAGAIRDFLSWARKEWERAPRYVLLVGDGTFDPRNFLGKGRVDFIPPALVDTSAMETASDDWFVDFDGNGKPDMAIGRLPVRSPAEAGAVVAKIVGWRGMRGDLGNDVLMISGADPAVDFVEYSRSALQALPGTVRRRELLLEGGAQADPRTRLLAELKAGALAVNYFGHGSVELLDSIRFMTSADVSSLDNGSDLPVFLLMTCLNGFFHDVYTDSLGETLVRAPNGGGVAAFASSTLTNAEQQRTMDRVLLAALFSGATPTLGDAVVGAKLATEDPDVRRAFVLLGDPSMPLDPDARFPDKDDQPVMDAGTVGDAMDPAPPGNAGGCDCRLPAKSNGPSTVGLVVVACFAAVVLSRRKARRSRRR